MDKQDNKIIFTDDKGNQTELTILSIKINLLRNYSSSTSFEKNIINKSPSDIFQ